MKSSTRINKIAYLFVAFYMLVSYSLSAQDNYFKVSGQYRLRPEFRSGYRTLKPDSASPAVFLGQRARLIFDYKKDKINFFVSINDTRTWGDEIQRNDIGGLSVNQLWVELALKKGFSLKLGRQELSYDDQRLLGALDWANSSISHDAAVLKYANKEKGLSFHLGGAYNDNGEPNFKTKYTIKNYKYLGFGWVKKEITSINTTVSGIAILNGVNSTVPNDNIEKANITFGPLLNYKKNALSGVLGAYYQTGKTESNLDINAFMVNAFGEYRKEKVFAGLGLDYISGSDDNTSATKSNSFNTLYATNHKFYGYMDYFLNIPTDTKQRGLVDLYARFGMNSGTKITTTLDAHIFNLANSNNLGAVKIDKYLGTEIDLLLDYKIAADMNLQAGYAMMFATSSMEYLKGGNSANYNGWAYLMLRITPTFFMHEFKEVPVVQ